MPERVFSITEMSLHGRDEYGNAILRPTENTFEWTADGFSAPRADLVLGIKLRTTREDLPGAEEPTEQILGWNYQPVTVAGVWDDRYNPGRDTSQASGFALGQWEDFERLVKRGNYVRITFERVEVVGIIVEARFTYRRKWQIAYELTISPHKRNGADSVRPRRRETSITLDAKELAARARAAYTAAQAAQAEAPSIHVTSDLVERITEKVGEVGAMIDEIDAVISDRTGRVQQAVSSMSRLVSSFRLVRSSAQELITDLQAVRSDLDMAYESAIATLEFETWCRGLGYQARMLILGADEAEKALAKRVTPTAAALYRPHKGESLYAISTAFYGTPHRWREIVEANGLTTLTLQGTELLVIPGTTRVV